MPCFPSSWNDKKYCVPIAFMAMALCVLVSGCAKKTQALGSPEKEEKIAERAAAQLHTSRVLFNGGNESIYHSFRIPSIIKTNNGTLIAFAEGRRWNPGIWEHLPGRANTCCTPLPILKAP